MGRTLPTPMHIRHFSAQNAHARWRPIARAMAEMSRACRKIRQFLMAEAQQADGTGHRTVLEDGAGKRAE
jgi:hypothetical protein